MKRWAALLILIASPTFAQSSADAMQLFGIIGTWSDNCANPKKQRITFTPATITVDPGDGAGERLEFEIVSATMVTKDKLVIKNPDGEDVFQKYGEKISWGGRELLEKCLK